jgi:membrane fusion protein (multidrug efflux system)
MIYRKRMTYWIVVAFIISATFWLGFFYKSSEKAKLQERVPVEVEPVGTGSIERTVELTGWIQADIVVEVRSKVPGRIETLQTTTKDGRTIAVEEGVWVAKDQQLAVIDHDVYLAQVEAAKAAVKAREVELADAEREKKRLVALYEGGSVTEQSRDKAVTAAELAEASLALARANLELAEINLRESRIVSPIDGVIIARHIDRGNLIQAQDRIVTIADIRTVKIITAVAERYGSEISADTDVKVRVDAFADKVFEAKVYSVYPALDEQTHTIQIEIRLANDELLLKPGMFARVTLITARRENVVIVPRDVVLGGKIDEPYAYVVRDGKACKRIVKLGVSQGENVEIADGLKQGEALVVNGMHYLTDQTAVEVVKMEDVGIKKQIPAEKKETTR